MANLNIQNNGRWFVYVKPDGAEPGESWPMVPVVPCDEAAIGRAIDAAERKHLELGNRFDYEAMIRAAFKAALP